MTTPTDPPPSETVDATADAGQPEADRDPATGRLRRGTTVGRRTQFQPNNQVRLVHGMRSNQRRTGAHLSDEQLVALAERRQAIVADIRDASTVKMELIGSFLEVGVLKAALAEDLLRRGVLTVTGRRRAALSAFLDCVDRQAKLAQHIGLNRVERPVSSLDAYLDSRRGGEGA